jgi:nucleoside-diphosphate kinase
MIERTLVLIKPDGVKRGLIGELVRRFEQRGLKLIGMKMIQIDSDFSKKHYSNHIQKPFYKYLEDYITSGPVVAMVIEGVHAVEIVRKIVGPTEPKAAIPGTIRGDYAHISRTYADGKNKPIINLIHASGTKEEAETEIAIWFKKEELCSYKRTDEEHIF